MARLHNPTVGLLLTGLLLLQGARGESESVFTSAGRGAILPCGNVSSSSSQCSATTWIYSKNGTDTVEIVTHGQIKPESTPRAKTLHLLRNCSLQITDVTPEDAGLYTCQQYPNGGPTYRDDDPVYLSVLTTSGVTESETSRDETIYCNLHFYRGLQSVVYDRQFCLMWVDDGGTELQTNDCQRFQGESPCSIPLNVELSDPNPTHTQRTWRCQVIKEGQVLTSVSHTIRVAVKPTRTPVATRQPAPPQPATPAQPQPGTTPSQPASAPPKSTVAPTSTSSMEAAIRLSVFFIVLIVPGLIGAVHLVRRRKQTRREDTPAMELQVLN